MYSFLPDELLSEILAPALQVPDDSFACIIGKSPFINYERSTSAYLLVCKDWLRVSTPLLYSVVVLRSKAQIQALEFALKSTPELGGFVKKLRVESGYSVSLHKILQSTTNLTDLCLSLEVYSSDNVSGICKGFPFVNPRRVIVYRPEGIGRSWNQKTQQMVDSLKEHLGKWDKLTTFVFPNQTGHWMVIRRKQECYVEGLEKSKSIETVSTESPSHQLDATWFERLCNVPTLKKIIIRGGQNLYLSTLLKSKPQFKKLFYYTTDYVQPTLQEDSPPPLPKTMFPQRNLITAFSNDIWLIILRHAFGIPALEDPDFRYPILLSNKGIFEPKYRQGLTLICKPLHKLALPLYYHSIVLVDHKTPIRIKSLLRQKPHVGNMVKSLFTVDFNFAASVTQNINDILEHTPNLERVAVDRIGRQYHSVSADILDWNSLTKLSQKAGHSLLDLSIHLHRPTTTKPPDVFYAFSKLKNLEFSSSAKFIVEPDEIKKGGKSMPCLESITFRSISNTLLSVMSHMDLPKIQKAQFPVLEKSEGAITFLRKHGHKLRTLEIGFLPGVSVFDVCPNLVEFIVPVEKPGFAVAEFFSSTDEHPLQIIHIKTKGVAQGAVKDKFKYIGDLDLSNFTSLERIIVDSCLWPITENEIKKSHWVTWAERLLKEYEVNIVNADDQHWIPRLRAK